MAGEWARRRHHDFRDGSVGQFAGPSGGRIENLEIAIGPATLKGRLERQAISGQTPTLSVALNGDSLDLDYRLGGNHTGVMPRIHRCCAGMVRRLCSPTAT